MEYAQCFTCNSNLWTTWKHFHCITDDNWNVFEATDILPAYKDNMFLTIDDAYEAAIESINESKRKSDIPEKVRHIRCLFFI